MAHQSCGKGNKAKKCVSKRREELAASKAADGPPDSAEVTGDLNKSKLEECFKRMSEKGLHPASTDTIFQDSCYKEEPRYEVEAERDNFLVRRKTWLGVFKKEETTVYLYLAGDEPGCFPL